MSALNAFANQTEGFAKYWECGVSFLEGENPSVLGLKPIKNALKLLEIPNYILLMLELDQVKEAIKTLPDPSMITLQMLVEARVNDRQVFFQQKPPKSADSSDSKSESARPDIAQFYSAKYQNRDELVKYLLDEIDENLELYKNETVEGYHSCYTSIVQASMVGKSRRMQQCLEEVFGFYINFLQGGTGFPQKTKIVSDWLIDSLKSASTKPVSLSGDRLTDDKGLQSAFAFYIACLECLNSWLNQQKQAPPETFKDAVTLWNKLQGEDSFWHAITNRSFVHIQNGNLRLKLSTTLRDLRSSIDVFLLPFEEKTKDTLFPKFLRVLFVFDEARVLLTTESYTPFQRLRNVLKYCHRENPFMFALFADTNSKLCHFSPKSERFPSARDQEVNRKKLFKPICGIPSFDVWPECYSLDHSMRTIVMPFFLSFFGRAALHVHMLPTGESTEYDRAGKLLELLYNKLTQRTAGLDKKLEHRLSAVSALAFRLKLTTAPTRRFTQDLVATKLQVCSEISDDRSAIYLEGTPEPMIALAAKRVLQNMGWPDVLSKLRSCSVMDVNVGANGEALSQMLMLMAADIVHDTSDRCKNMVQVSLDLKAAHEKGQCVLPISLLDFLKQLVGPKLDTCDSLANEVRKRTPSLPVPSISESLENVFMRFLLFDRVEHEPDRIVNDVLAHMFYRSAGIMMAAGFPGIDALIPLLNRKLNPDQSVMDEVISPDMFSAMTVQFKNYHKAPGMSTYREWLNLMKMNSVCQNSLLPDGAARVALLIDLGDETELKVYRFILDNEPPGVHTIALAVRGLKPSHFIPGPETQKVIQADKRFRLIRGNSNKPVPTAVKRSMFRVRYDCTAVKRIIHKQEETGVKRKSQVEMPDLKKRKDNRVNELSKNK